MAEDPFAKQSGMVIWGDPVIALAAQVNRLTESQLYSPAPGQLSRDLASSAIMLMQTIAIAAALTDPGATDEVNALTQAMKDPVPYVAPRVPQITRALAIYGDRLGRSPAQVGITKRDPRFSHKWDTWMWLSVVGAASITAIGAMVAAKRLARSTAP